MKWQITVISSRSRIVWDRLWLNKETYDWFAQDKKGEAEDMGEIVSLNETVIVPYGSFNKCIKTKDWTPLEPDVVEYKYYSTVTGSVVLETEVGSKTRVELIEIIKDTEKKKQLKITVKRFGRKISRIF